MNGREGGGRGRKVGGRKGAEGGGWGREAGWREDAKKAERWEEGKEGWRWNEGETSMGEDGEGKGGS